MKTVRVKQHVRKNKSRATIRVRAHYRVIRRIKKR